MAAHGLRMHGQERRGLMFVLSSPSGAGKTTLSRLLLESDKDITLSVCLLGVSKLTAILSAC